MWKTGGAAYDDQVKAMLGLEPQDHIVALLYLGKADVKGPVPEVPLEQLVTWL
jgi:nitroreductase